MKIAFQVRLVTLLVTNRTQIRFNPRQHRTTAQLPWGAEGSTANRVGCQGYRRIRETALGQCCGTGGLRLGTVFWAGGIARVEHPLLS